MTRTGAGLAPWQELTRAGRPLCHPFHAAEGLPAASVQSGSLSLDSQEGTLTPGALCPEAKGFIPESSSGCGKSLG